MSSVCTYASSLCSKAEDAWLFSVTGGLVSATVCYHVGVSILATICTSAVTVPFLITGIHTILTQSNDREVSTPIFNKVYAITFFTIAILFQSTLPFIQETGSVLYWAIPKFILIKTAGDLFYDLDLLEFRKKQSYQPPAYSHLSTEKY